MIFNRIAPELNLTGLVDCFWTASGSDREPCRVKIIPDGFTEIIFHFADPYRIRLEDSWELQTRSLLAGQITKHFFLENTGASEILGVKLKPTTISKFFKIPMRDLTDKVVDLLTALPQWTTIEQLIYQARSHEERISLISRNLAEVERKENEMTPIDKAVAAIFEKKGMLRVNEIAEEVNLGERQLENLFREHVGVSPKLFSRIVRFNYIFEVVRNNRMSWCDLAYEAAYYDQSHFIRNFKDFTGENPADYFFEEKTMANFFLQKGREK
jgi:AraC-like DNA-binding protein